MISKNTKTRIRSKIKGTLEIPYGNEAIFCEIHYLCGFCTALAWEDKISASTLTRYYRIFYKLSTGMISFK